MSARWLRLFSIVLALCVVAASLVTAVVPAASAAATANQLWSPFPVAKTASVKGHPLAKGSHQLTVREPAGVSAQEYRPLAAPAWPAAGSAVAHLGGGASPWSAEPTTAASGVSVPAPAEAGSLPVWV